jgi:hypothetical protein
MAATIDISPQTVQLIFPVSRMPVRISPSCARHKRSGLLTFPAAAAQVPAVTAPESLDQDNTFGSAFTLAQNCLASLAADE